MTGNRETCPIPPFANEAEAGEFWVTHSPLDYPDQFEPVDVRLPRLTGKRGLTIKLDNSIIEELRSTAQVKGIGPSTLARMWILERLRQERGASPPSKE